MFKLTITIDEAVDVGYLAMIADLLLNGGRSNQFDFHVYPAIEYLLDKVIEYLDRNEDGILTDEDKAFIEYLESWMKTRVPHA